MKISLRIIFVSIGFFCASCGGSGGSSDSGNLIEGTLTEAGGAGHTSVLLKHSSGQYIENVKICALNQCSTTDKDGQWGFILGENFPGGNTTFTVSGHGIETSSVIEIPAGANEVFLDLQHVEGGLVKAEHITVDGVESHHETEHHETEQH